MQEEIRNSDCEKRNISLVISEKGWKIPKGSPEAPNQMTNNTMTDRKRTNNDVQNTTQKTKD